MPDKNFKKQKGFTLIELLVVILVIGALSGVLLGVVNSQGVRAKARDSQRKADLNKIRLALEIYFADTRSYPISNNGSGDGTWEQINSPVSQINKKLVSAYINPMPVDPLKSTVVDVNPCNTPANKRYLYKTPAGGSSYMLVSLMEITTSADDSRCNQAELGVACLGDDPTEYCYIVKSP